MLIVGFILSVLISVILGIYCYRLKINKLTIIALNNETQKENDDLEKANHELKQQHESILESIRSQDNILKSLMDTSEKMRQEAQDQAQRDYEVKQKELQANFEAKKTSLSAEYQRLSDAFDLKIDKQREELNDLLAKQLAYIQAQQRQEEIAANQDYYRLSLDKLDLNDVTLLRELQPRFIKKDAIDKVIYETYYRPAYDILMSHLFSGTAKICGIYKITDLTTGQAYIGQSVDIRERFRQHIRSALSYGKATNRLYQTMQKSGVHNFTFEILEEVSREKLNERETYWIDFYKTKDYGLNSTRGGS